MRMKRNTGAEQRHLAQTCITNTVNDAEIRERVSARGYTPEIMEEGQMLYNKALWASNDQVAALGAKKLATAQAAASKKLAVQAYQDLAKIARALFVGRPSMLATLGLNGKMPKSISALITAGLTLFANAENESVLPHLVLRGYDAAKLAAERNNILQFQSDYYAQEKASGAAQQATEDKNKAMKAMNAWVRQYLKIAQVALSDKPELLAKLGL